ncbi:hypothetical protein ACLVWU_00475 [Bdellovibrio sp. HCB290]|uniref:hypothetical protein n=1 Tax=Bdellovibrio sp. HCB290 TaxID=3394356 RepID=UPI0039B53BBC
MRNVTTILGLMLMSSMVFASDCNTAVLKVAKLNIDLKAKAYGFESGGIIKNSLKKVNQDSETGSTAYMLGGWIYKSDYEIQVVVDSSCGIETLKIID